MRNSFCTGQDSKLRWKEGSAANQSAALKRVIKARGIAISIDALLAMILTIAFIGFIGIGMQGKEETTTKATTRISQTAEDVFTALDKSGYLAQQLVGNVPLATGVNNIYNKAASMLPASTGLRVEIKEYTPPDDLGKAGTLGTCKEEKDLATCFPSQTLLKSGEPIPPDKEVLHGRKMQIMRQPVPDSATKCEVIALAQGIKNEEKPTAMLQGGGQAKQLTTQIMVKNEVGATPSVINCDETVTVTAKMRNSRRDPVAIMLAVDESKSMGIYDMLQQQTSGFFNNGTCGGQQCGQSPTGFSDNWQPLGTLYVSQALLDAMPSSAVIRFETSTSTVITTSCGKMPRLRVKKSGSSTYFPNNNGAEVLVEVSKTSLSVGTWEVEGWSNQQIQSAIIYITIRWGAYQEATKSADPPDSPDSIDGGTVSIGTGNECDTTTYDNYQKIGEFTVDDASINNVSDKVKVNGTNTTVYTSLAYGRFAYKGYNGKCQYLSVKTKKPDDTWFPTQFERCPKPDDDWCVSSGGGSDGTYKIYAWSDFSMPWSASGTPRYTAKYYLTKATTANISATILGSGTCTGLYVPCGDYDNYVMLDPFELTNVPSENHLRGLLVKLTNDSYTGACGSQKIRLINGGNVYPANYYSFEQPGGCTTSGCKICINEDDGQCVYPNGTVHVETDGLPVNSGTWQAEAWSDVPLDYTLDWYIERIDAAKKAAKKFIDDIGTNWGYGTDLLGALSYSNTVRLKKELNTDTSIVRNDEFLNALEPNSQTATGDAIKSAADSLSVAEEGKKRILILLTDGRANLCAGGAGCSEEDAANYAIGQANTARAEPNNITIYVVGFADESIMTGYEATLKDIAWDCGTYGQNPKTTNCGGYYYAANAEQLAEALEIIRAKALQQFGPVEITFPFPNGMELQPMSGYDSGRYGVWDDDIGGFESTLGTGTLTSSNWNEDKRQIVLDSSNSNIGISSINHLSPYWFAVQFNVKMPCNGAYCLLDYVLFPPKRGSEPEDGPSIYDEDDLLTPNYEWPGNCDGTTGENCCTDTCTDNYMRIPFKYSNLKINFLDGDIKTGKVSLDLKVSNMGYKSLPFTASPYLNVSFYANDEPPAKTVGACSGDTPCTLAITDPPGQTVPPATAVSTGSALQLKNITFCPSKNGGACSSGGQAKVATVSDVGVITDVSGGQYIYAKINEYPNLIPECSLDNTAVIYCLPQPRFKFYTIDYYVWGK